MDLQGMVALVTGASRGIGEAVAKELARQGAIVVGTATSSAGADAISTYLAEFGGVGMALDVNKPEEIESALNTITTKHGDIGILVNNAGIARDQLLMRMKEEDWDAVMDTNLRSVYRLSKAVLRGMMKARQGRIISVASVVGSAGSAGQTNYAAAKAGIMGFTRSLAREVGSRGITVNCVAPGFIDTDMTRNLPEEYRAKLIGQIALERLGSPQEIADAVAFLASKRAAYITGTTLHVNGGMYMN
ncbi:3-oxoacyl-ACP reductase FabG [Parachitinimonas caeni]|uniref:3-oxoacyl-[acyl-carrier-protein] reductase n=1 Tax=Parachitinimonas caeni TaxID=3031301 RepID=A0ABT7DUU0_9NEIS|nr:3-oxoacyl-ACP reductase FabG [Parachitinimonas caeni]MDK2123821.1 3-oxoacyl-ACP reductase FabG [Parachitinimonas caeni]